jgi:hypothetical protein
MIPDKRESMVWLAAFVVVIQVEGGVGSISDPGFEISKDGGDGKGRKGGER